MDQFCAHVRQLREERKPPQRHYFDGLCHLFGTAKKDKSLELAVCQFEQAAKKGSADAVWILNRIAKKYDTCPPRMLRDVLLDEPDCSKSCAFAAKLTRASRDVEIFHLLEKAAQGGNALAMVELAADLEYNMREATDEKVQKLIETSANLGDPFGQFKFSERYWLSQKERERLWVLSAQQGLVYSEVKLTEVNFKRGNLEEAVRWSGLAIAKGLWNKYLPSILCRTETRHDLNLRYMIGRSMCFDVYGSKTWLELADTHEKELAETMLWEYIQCYKWAQESTLCFLAVCKFRLRAPRDIYRPLAKEIWRGRRRWMAVVK
jgi:TPR repeat protein